MKKNEDIKNVGRNALSLRGRLILNQVKVCNLTVYNVNREHEGVVGKEAMYVGLYLCLHLDMGEEYHITTNISILNVTLYVRS